jgi:hypothetical protein
MATLIVHIVIHRPTNAQAAVGKGRHQANSLLAMDNARNWDRAEWRDASRCSKAFIGPCRPAGCLCSHTTTLDCPNVLLRPPAVRGACPLPPRASRRSIVIAMTPLHPASARLQFSDREGLFAPQKGHTIWNKPRPRPAKLLPIELERRIRCVKL